MKKTALKQGGIRIGIGGWTYEPWRKTFYPKDLVQAKELWYASRQLTAIEINGTFYRSQAPSTFAKWRDTTPDDFLFSVKAVRYATNRRVLAEAGPSIDKFVGSGLAKLGSKLGPILWQFAPGKKFDAADFEAFLKLLPAEVDGLRLRHVVEPRHESFMCDAFIALARKYGVAIVFTDSPDYPNFTQLTADFVYLRLMNAKSSIKTGYAAKDLAAWVERAQLWAAGGDPMAGKGAKAVKGKVLLRDVFMFVINGAKERAPAAATAILEKLAA